VARQQRGISRPSPARRARGSGSCER
jgi:hypothetical protein